MFPLDDPIHIADAPLDVPHEDAALDVPHEDDPLDVADAHHDKIALSLEDFCLTNFRFAHVCMIFRDAHFCIKIIVFKPFLVGHVCD